MQLHFSALRQLFSLPLQQKNLHAPFLFSKLISPKLTLTLFNFVRINFALVQALMSHQIGSPQTYTSESVSD